MARSLFSVDPVTTQLIDENGRSRLFRGLNVVFKEPPYIPEMNSFDPFTSFCPEDAALLARLGMNVIRLSVSWPALQPVKDGPYQLDYLQQIRRIVRMCAAEGIYTLLEFHQDVFCSQFCGNGVPDWVFEPSWTSRWTSFPFPLRWPFPTLGPFHMPDARSTKTWTWYLGYLTYAVSVAFQKCRAIPYPFPCLHLTRQLIQVYDNDRGLLDAFAKFWRAVAEAFKDEPFVLGYELINEPWLGNVYHNPLLFWPGYAGRHNVHRLNQKVGSAIREVDPYTAIFISDPTLDTSSGFPDIPFPHKPSGDSTDTEYGPAVLSYHYYRPPHRCSASTFMKSKRAAAKRLQAGMFMTEFEVWPGPPQDGEAKVQDITKTLQAADEHLQSWIGWSYKTFAQPKSDDCWDGSIFGPDGKAIVHMQKILARPYAPCVAGRILRMYFDEEAVCFTLVFKENGRASAPTLIYTAKQFWYPLGFKVTVERRVNDTSQACPFTVPDSHAGAPTYISIDPATATDQAVVHVIIRPATEL